MSDIRIVSVANLAGTYADWNFLLPPGVLDETEELANYVRVALMTDATAAPTDILPDPDSDDRRGWWGDMDAALIWKSAWPIGCKNWLLSRAKLNDSPSFEGNTVVRAEDYTRTALNPLITMGMASALDVVAYRASDYDQSARFDQINCIARIYRGPLPEVALLFQDLWQDMMITPIRSPYGYAAVAQLLPPPSSGTGIVGQRRR